VLERDLARILVDLAHFAVDERAVDAVVCAGCTVKTLAASSERHEKLLRTIVVSYHFTTTC
jgi:hypothetical protein